MAESAEFVTTRQGVFVNNAWFHQKKETKKKRLTKAIPTATATQTVSSRPRANRATRIPTNNGCPDCQTQMPKSPNGNRIAGCGGAAFAAFTHARMRNPPIQVQVNS